MRRTLLGRSGECVPPRRRAPSRRATVENRWPPEPAEPTLYAMEEPHRRIRALHTAATITVYQAYSPEIGMPAIRDGRFPAAWKPDRMTWIKPSFLWMMYRSNWGTSAGQETVLAIEIDRGGFDWALRHSCLSSYVRGLHPDRSTWQRDLKRAPSRVQWDPERDLNLRPLPHRSLQLGLSGEASSRYADEWIVSISDVTPLAREIRALVGRGDPDSAAQLLPQEQPYPADDELLAHLGRGPG